MYVRALPTTDVNRNTEWFTYPGVWTTYILILFFSWLVVLAVFHCSIGIAWTIVHLAHFTVIKSFDPGCLERKIIPTDVEKVLMNEEIMWKEQLSWKRCRIVYEDPTDFEDEGTVSDQNSTVTFHSFHWKKGTPFGDDQGIYNSLTWWEQIDNGKQLTRNRKFLTLVPVVLYLIASHTTDYQHPMLFLNTLAVFVMVVAKFPHMHKVRIFGINADQ